MPLPRLRSLSRLRSLPVDPVIQAEQDWRAAVIRDMHENSVVNADTPAARAAALDAAAADGYDLAFLDKLMHGGDDSASDAAGASEGAPSRSRSPGPASHRERSRSPGTAAAERARAAASAAQLPPRRAPRRITRAAAAAAAAGGYAAAPESDSDDEKSRCALRETGCENLLLKKVPSHQGGDFCKACKRGTILCGVKHVYRNGNVGPAAWRLSDPTPANPAESLTDARATHLASELAGYHGHLNLAKPVPVEVRRFYKKTNELLLYAHYGLAGYNRLLDVAVQLDDPRLVLTGSPTPKPPPKSIKLSLPAYGDGFTLDDIEAAVAQPELLRDFGRKVVALAAVWERTIDPTKLRERCVTIQGASDRWKELYLPVLKKGCWTAVSEDEPGVLYEVITSTKRITCQVVGCGEWGVWVNSTQAVSVCKYHFNPLILRRHPDTGALSAESWPLCYDCVTRRRIDEIDAFKPGSQAAWHGTLAVLCRTCNGGKRARHARQVAKAKPMATKAIEKRDTAAGDDEKAAKAKAAKLVAEHWAEQTCTTALEAYTWGWLLAGDEDGLLQRTTAEAAVALFEEEEEKKNGGGSAEG